MSEAAMVIIGGLIAFAASVLTAWITSRVTAKRNSADVKLARIVHLEGRVDNLEKKDRVHQDYIVKLRHHILSGSPPPPPEWPEYETTG